MKEDKEKEECKQCGGSGYYADHAPMNEHAEDENDGTPICVNCPVQVPCENCSPTSLINKE